MGSFSDWLKKMRVPRQPREECAKILILSTNLEDRFLLEGLGEEYGWDIWFTQSPAESFHLAETYPFELILCDRSQHGYPWREVLARLTRISPASCVLLISPAKDDYLWGEVLQQGGYDIVERPLHDGEVRRAVDAALRYTSTCASNEPLATARK